MATTKPVPMMNPDDDKGNKKVDDTVETPPEFSVDATETTGISTEALNDNIFNDKQYEDDYKKMNPPVGDWIKDGRWSTYKMVVKGDDSITGDVGLAKKEPYTGRTYYSVSGRPEVRISENVEHQPMLFFRISPDKRYKQDKPAEFDSAYKLFMRAREVYLTIHGKSMHSEADIKYMFEEDSYVLRTMNGDNGPIVVDMKAKRVQR